MPPSRALLGGFAIGARVALLWQHNTNPSYKLASIPRYDDIVRTLSGMCARCWPVTGGWRGAAFSNCAPYMGSGRGWLAGNWRRRGGVLNITAAAWTAGFQWWRSGDITRTKNVSEYMLVLAVYLYFEHLCSRPCSRAPVHTTCVHGHRHGPWFAALSVSGTGYTRFQLGLPEYPEINSILSK